MATLRDRNKAWSFDGRIGDGHSGWIYAIQSEAGGPIKIGFAADPLVRLTKLQTMNPVVLRVLGICRGSIESERAMHDSLAAHRLHGEWFSDVGDVRAAIAHFEPLDETWFQAKRGEQRAAAKVYVRREIPPVAPKPDRSSRTRISYDLTPEQEEERLARLRVAARALEL